MTAAFGHRWTSAHGDDFTSTSGRLWAVELAGLGQQSIRRGLDLAMKAEWPPVLAEFKAACLGVLPIAEVDADLAREPSAWRPFSVLVKRNIDDTEWRMAGGQSRWQILERAHGRAKAHVLGGGRLPEYTEASLQLTAQDHQEPPPAIMVTTAQAMAAIKASLGIKEAGQPPQPEPDLAPVDPGPCIRCKGTRIDPLPAPGMKLQRECVACFGSGEQHAYNRLVHDDGTIEDRIP